MLDLLSKELASLSEKLQAYNIKLIIGGGYGLYLRTESLRKNNPRTFFNNIPIARSTEDLDIFLSIHLITSLEKMRTIRTVLNEMGYEPKPDAKFYQFWKQVDLQGQSRRLKLDFLSPAILGKESSLVVQRNRRIRPRATPNTLLAKNEQMHARITEEATSLEDYLDLLYIDDRNYVYIPHPFTYMILKLFAIKDHIEQPETKGKAPHHSFDLYRTVAMLTELEEQQATSLVDKYPNLSDQARNIIGVYFNNLDSLGTLSLRRYIIDNQPTIGNESVEVFLEYLRDLFNAKDL